MNYKESISKINFEEHTPEKIRLVCNDEVESIWVIKDPENKLMFLVNNCVALSPLPSWGLELPIGDSVDITELRGESPINAKLTVHSIMYKRLLPALNKEGVLDWDKLNQLREDEQTKSNQKKKS